MARKNLFCQNAIERSEIDIAKKPIMLSCNAKRRVFDVESHKINILLTVWAIFWTL